jgi:hypothetical protein
LTFQLIGLMEYILCYSALAVHWGLLPVTRLASRKILIEQNIKRRTGPALCLFSLLRWYPFSLSCLYSADRAGMGMWQPPSHPFPTFYKLKVTNKLNEYPDPCIDFYKQIKSRSKKCATEKNLEIFAWLLWIAWKTGEEIKGRDEIQFKGTQTWDLTSGFFPQKNPPGPWFTSLVF